MVIKNNVKKELNKLNDELDSHLDVSSVGDDFSVFEKKLKDDSLNFDTLTLLKDIRDEMSLLRKNVFSDAESLISRKIKKDQELFFTKIQENFLKLSNHVVSSKDHNFQSLRAENVGLQNELKKLRSNQEILNDKLNTLTQLILEKNIHHDGELHLISDSIQELKQKVEILPKSIPSDQLISSEVVNIDLEIPDSEEVIVSKSSNSLLVEDRLARIDATLENLK